MTPYKSDKSLNESEKKYNKKKELIGKSKMGYLFSLLILLAFSLQDFIQAAGSREPYPFAELINSNIDRNSDRLKYDYDISLPESVAEVYEIDGKRDSYWNERMLQTKKEIKHSRIRQMENFRELTKLQEEIDSLSEKIVAEDEIIKHHAEICLDLENEPIDVEPPVTKNFNSEFKWSSDDKTVVIILIFVTLLLLLIVKICCCQ